MDNVVDSISHVSSHDVSKYLTSVVVRCLPRERDCAALVALCWLFKYSDFAGFVCCDHLERGRESQFVIAEGVCRLKDIVGSYSEVVGSSSNQVFQNERVGTVRNVFPWLNEATAVPTIVLQMVAENGRSTVVIMLSPGHFDRA